MNSSRSHSLQLGKVSGFPRTWDAVLARLPFLPKSRRTSSFEMEVESGEVVRFQHPGGLSRITCLRGLLWITQEGDGLDYVLHRGETYVPRAKGLVLVEGMHASLIRCSGV